MDDRHEPDLAELQSRFMLQQDTLDKLSEVVWRQQKDLEILARRVTTLEKRLAVARESPDAGDAPPDDPPPHY